MSHWNKRIRALLAALALSWATIGVASDAVDKPAADLSKAAGPRIGISKQFIYAGLSGGLPLVKTRFTVTNYGDQTISDLAITEDLNAVFGAGNSTHITDPAQLNGEGSLNYNAAFDGSATTQLLSAGSALAPDEFVIFEISTRVNTLSDQGFGSGVYRNQVTVSGNDEGMNPITDLSHAGSNPDPDNDQDPSNNSDVTEINLNDDPVIGIAKNVSVVGNQVTLDFYLENLGNVALSDLAFDDNLDQRFSSGNYTIDSLSFIDDPGTLTLNAGYDGSSEINVLDIGNSTLAAGDTAQIRLVLTVNTLSGVQGLGLGNYSNQVIVTGISSSAFIVSDTSDFGTDPDPNGNSNPDEAGENDATTFSITSLASAGVALQAVVDRKDVVLNYTIENLGAEAINTLSLVHSLSDTFGAGNFVLTSAPSVTSGSIALNAGFDGNLDTELLGAGASIAVGATVQIQLALSIVDVQSGAFSAQATLSYTDSGGVTSADLSDAGTDPDTGGNGNAGDTGENDPTTIVPTPGIGLAQQVTVQGNVVNYQIVVENVGVVPLTGITSTWQLLSVYGFGNYSIATAPSVVGGNGSVTLNSSFDGLFSPSLITSSGTFQPGDRVVIHFAINVTNVTNQGSGFGVYPYQGTVSALDPSGATITDLSDDGIEPDSDGDGVANEAGENDISTATIGDEANPGVALDLALSGTQVTVDIYLENLGANTLSNLSLTNNLNAVFGAGNYTISSGPSLIDDPGTITLEAAFDGAATTEMLDAASTLAVADTAQIQLVVDVTTIADVGLGTGSYVMQVSFAASAPGGSMATDLSDDGTDPDPNGNSRPGDANENDANAFSISALSVGLAKSAAVVGDEVTFTFNVANVGNQSPTLVEVIDDLDAVFGAGNYSIQQAPQLVGAPHALTANASYTGQSGSTVVASGSVAAGVSDSVDLVVRVERLTDQGSGVGVYSNQAQVDFDAQSDLSDSGTDPDTDGDGNPNEAGENDPTVFSVAQRPVIGLAHAATVVVDQVTLDYYLENLGNVDLSSISLVDDLDAVFGSGNYTIAAAPSFLDNPGTLVLNAGFDGSAQTNLLTSGSLAYADTAQIRVVIEVLRPIDSGSGTGVYSNQASASAQGPDTTVSNDDSDAGVDPDSDADLEPNEAGENDPTPITVVLVVPSAPLNLVATTGNTTASIAFDLPTSNGGRSITNYEYSLDGGMNWTAFAPAVTASPVSLTGLTNGVTYDVQLRAVNSVGSGTASSTVQVTALPVPDAPTGLVATAGDQSASISFTAGSDQGLAISNYEYTLDAGANWIAFSPAQNASPVSLTGLSNGVTYTVQLRAINVAGAGAASAAVMVTPVAVPDAPTGLVATGADQSASVSFTPGADNGAAITNYEISIDFGGYTAFSPAVIGSPVTINGLNNGQSYDLRLRAVNAVGAGAESASVQVVPFTVPDAPNLVIATGGDSFITINFEVGANNGSVISNFEFSTDGGGSFTAFSPAIPNTQFVESGTITGLDNGTTYDIQVRAVNAAGAGAASNTLQATPVGPPDAPTGLMAAAGNESAQIAFTPGSDNGDPINSYDYSLDGGTNWIGLGNVTSPVTISPLVNGTTYDIVLRARNALGVSPASASVQVVPLAVPDAPTNLSHTAGNHQVTVSFTEPSGQGSAILNYEYSLDEGVTWIAFSPAATASPVTITGLTNGDSIPMLLRAVNALGSGPSSAFHFIKAFTVPSAPTINFVVPGNTQLTLEFIGLPDNGGDPISNYEFSLNGGISFTAMSPVDNLPPLTLTGLSNGTTYDIQVRAVNAAGSGAASATVQGTPRNLPDAPTNLSATPGDQSATLSFTAAADNGSAITEYQYSLDGGVSYNFTGATGSPITITGLTNGTTYDISLAAINDSGRGPLSAAVQVTPRTVPDAPTALVATPGNQQATISFTAGADNGAAISNYEFSIDGGASFTSFSPAVTGSPVTLSGLTNGTTYDVQLRAVNAAGIGAASATVQVTPQTLPGAPTGLNATPGDQSATISFTAGADNGSPITNYEFSLDGGASWTALTPAATVSPVVITGLTNGTSYSIQLRAINAAGPGVPSLAVAVTPQAVPAAPTNLVATAGDQSVSISFVAGSDNGSAITGYEYSLDDGTTWLAFAPPITASPALIEGLTNGVNYSIRLRALNALGAGAPSAPASVTPQAVPAAPAALNAVPGNASITLTFVAAADNGSPITNYEYSLDAGITWIAFAPAVTSSPVTISGLVNGTPYQVQLRAINALGAGLPATLSAAVIPFTAPSAPRNVRAVLFDGRATVTWDPPLSDGGSAIESYVATAQPGGLSCTVTGAPPPTTCVIFGLDPNIPYEISVIAFNAAGGASPAGAMPGVLGGVPRVIPSAGPWALLMLGLLLGVFGWRSRARRQHWRE